MASGESNGHVTDDVTNTEWQTRDPNTLEPNNSKTAGDTETPFQRKWPMGNQKVT